MKKILAVVVTYRKPDLAASIALGLIKQRNVIINVILIDNSLNKEYHNLLREFIGNNNICIYESEENLGYARGNNFGVELGSKIWGNADYILFSNDDIVVEDVNLLNSLTATFTIFHNIGCLQPKIILKDGYIQGPYNKSNIYIESLKYFFPPFWYFISYYRQYHLKNIKKNIECFRVMGAFFIIDFNIFNEVKGFDNNTFLFREEEILAIKLKKNGYCSYYNPSHIVLHLQEKKSSTMYEIVDHSDLYFYDQILKKSKFSILIFIFSKFIFRKIYLPFLHFIRFI